MTRLEREKAADSQAAAEAVAVARLAKAQVVLRPYTHTCTTHIHAYMHIRAHETYT